MLVQPFSMVELGFTIDRAYRHVTVTRDLASIQRDMAAKFIDGLVGRSKAMETVSQMVHKVAPASATVRITGESGTGKEMVAQAIHRLSRRSQKPFVALAACALPDSLIEDELFGHDKGAFTGAFHSRRGKFEEANGGTVFLDEVGDLSLPLQAKLLRVLQERTVERLGSNVSIPLDIRLICATNRDLEAMVRQETFRKDLYFRISVVNIQLPPLRDRMEDISLLVEHFLRKFAALHSRNITGISSGYLSALGSYEWPGNVREIQNVIERSIVLADGVRLGVEDLPDELRALAASCEIPASSFHIAVGNFKRELIRRALRLRSGNKLKAALDLGISRCYLHRLLNQLNIASEPDAGRPSTAYKEIAMEEQPGEYSRV